MSIYELPADFTPEYVLDKQSRDHREEMAEFRTHIKKCISYNYDGEKTVCLPYDNKKYYYAERMVTELAKNGWNVSLDTDDQCIVVKPC